MTVAQMTLRFGTERVPTTVNWPSTGAASLALVLSDELSPTAVWVESYVVVALVGRHPAPAELAALHWLAEHAGELGAESDRMLVAGGARAARLVLDARDSGWPILRRQLLVHPRFTAQLPMPANVAGAPAATVVCNGWDDGRRYAARLRAAGLEVRVMRG